MNSVSSQAPDSVTSWLRRRSVQYALGGIVAGFAFPLIACVIKLDELHVPFKVANLLAMQLMDPVIWITDTAPFFLGALAAVAGRREDLLLRANELLVQREAELGAIRQGLEESVSERTRQLDQRNAQMRAVLTFARLIADIRELPALLSTSVQVISERFGYPEVSLFMLDENRQVAVLRAASSPNGQALIQQNFHVALTDQGAVGRGARRGTLLISRPHPGARVEDARASSAGLVAEIALPLIVRGRVTGVLHVRATEAQATGQSEAEILQSLADQLAASIENVRLVSESRAAVEQLQAVSAQTTRSVWQQRLKSTRVAYQFTPAGVRSAPSMSSNGSSGGLKIPLKLRGQEIGALSVKRAGSGGWTTTERDLLEKLAVQVALAVENARLIEETRQRAAQEQIISEISARFSRSLDVEALLQAAVREFASLPEVAEATVVLKPTNETSN